nr:unnamed protein product [Callosobruchus analis]
MYVLGYICGLKWCKYGLTTEVVPDSQTTSVQSNTFLDTFGDEEENVTQGSCVNHSCVYYPFDFSKGDKSSGTKFSVYP